MKSIFAGGQPAEAHGKTPEFCDYLQRPHRIYEATTPPDKMRRIERSDPSRPHYSKRAPRSSKILPYRKQDTLRTWTEWQNSVVCAIIASKTNSYGCGAFHPRIYLRTWFVPLKHRIPLDIGNKPPSGRGRKKIEDGDE